MPPRATACPECGSDETTGWSEAAVADRLDLPDQPFDYQDFVQREFGPASARPRGIPWFWWVAAIVVLLGFVLFFVRF